jgi:hypothetical protein
MPRNGSGGVTRPVGGAFPAVANTLIQAAKVNISEADILAMIAESLSKDGQTVATQRIPFASGISTDTINEKTGGAGVTLGHVLNTPQGADIVCAATINLETATGNVVDVTGSTGPVTAVTLSQGHWRIVRFTGTPTLTHGASLVLPGAANIVAAAGDYALFVGYAAGVVRAWYMRGNGNVIGPNISIPGSLVWGTGTTSFGQVVKRKTADESVTSSTTLQDDDHLTFAVAANEEWVVEAYLDVAITSANGFKVAFNAPSGATINAFVGFDMNVDGSFSSGQTTVIDTAVSAPFGTAATRVFARAHLWVLNGATPGTITLRWAQVTASGTTTMAKGSFMVAHRIA